MPKLNVLIAGSTGYIGIQLIKLLIKHKNISIKSKDNRCKKNNRRANRKNLRNFLYLSKFFQENNTKIFCTI